MPEDRRPIYQKLIAVRPDVHGVVLELANVTGITMGELVTRAVMMYGAQAAECGTEIDEITECGTEITEAVALK
jgi:hypothetical protein